jgi:uncharacterized protein (DUF1015 family)
MAEIKPFRAWRYNKAIIPDIETVTSPLFDVVSIKQREALYKNPYNSLHISVPQPPLPADRAALLLKEWKENNVLLQDKLPAIYVYYQYFTLAGSKKELCRKGFICNIRVYPWEDNVIQRHENTIPSSVNDRVELLERTELHVSPTHGLYTDETFSLEKYMDEAIRKPVLETEDYQGVRDVLAVIHDADVIQKFIQLVKAKKIILADGHHRYEGSLAHLHNQKRANPNHTGQEAYNFHLMYLTNTENDDLKILPTHRLIGGLPSFDQDVLLERLSKCFTIKPIEEPSTLNEIISGKKWAFGLVLPQQSFKLRLKEDMLPKLRWPFPTVIKELDLTVMHYFIIEKCLGIKGKDQRKTENIQFERNMLACIDEVRSGRKQLALITNEVSIDDVKRVCESGYTMPQKSTYFYPKVVTGFVFSSINEKEFKGSPYSPF